MRERECETERGERKTRQKKIKAKRWTDYKIIKQMNNTHKKNYDGTWWKNEKARQSVGVVSPFAFHSFLLERGWGEDVCPSSPHCPPFCARYAQASAVIARVAGEWAEK